jgi:phosphoglycolate phosphatase
VADTVGVLWDLDGTLIDSAGDIAAAADRMLVRAGLAPLGEARIRTFVGDGAANLVQRCVRAAGGAPEPAHLDDFLRDYSANLDARTRIHPPELLGLLPRIACPMAVVTNKPIAPTLTILDSLGLARFFGAVLGGDSLPTRKPDPEMVWEAARRIGCDRTVLVGDGPQDVEAARRAGVRSIGVEWGIHAPAGADVRVGDVRALEAALVAAGIPIRPPV